MCLLSCVWGHVWCEVSKSWLLDLLARFPEFSISASPSNSRRAGDHIFTPSLGQATLPLWY